MTVTGLLGYVACVLTAPENIISKANTTLLAGVVENFVVHSEQTESVPDVGKYSGNLPFGFLGTKASLKMPRIKRGNIYKFVH